MKTELLLILCITLLAQTQLISQEEIVKEGAVEKKITFSYHNLSGPSAYSLKQIYRTISPNNYNSLEYQITTNWDYSIGKVFNRPEEMRLSIELEGLFFENLPKYEGFQLKEPFNPESILITIAIKSPDTSFTSEIAIEKLNKKTSQLLALPATNAIEIEFTDIYLNYAQVNLKLAKSRVNQVNNLLKTKKYLEQLNKENRLLKIDYDDPDNILSSHAKIKKWTAILEDSHYQQGFWKALPSSILEITKIQSLRNQLNRSLQLKRFSLNKKIKNIHKIYVQRGYQFLENRDYSKAITDAEKALQNKPKNLAAYTLRTRIAWDVNGIDNSLSFFEKGSKYFSAASTQDAQDFISLGGEFKSHYIQSGNELLNERAFEEAILFYKKTDEFCRTYSMINCRDFNLVKNIQFVRQTQYYDLLDFTTRQIDLLQFESALASLESANVFFKTYQIPEKGTYLQLKKQATRGRWDELVTEANFAERKAIERPSRGYKEGLNDFERAEKAITEANNFRRANKSLLAGSYTYSVEKLNKHRYDFHFEYAENYAEEGNRKESLAQFKAAKIFMVEETTTFTKAYRKTFDAEHQYLVAIVLKEKEQASIKENGQLFKEARTILQNIERENEAVLELEESWLSKEAMIVPTSSKALLEKIRQQRLNMGKSAVGYYTSTKEFLPAKEFDQYVVDNKGESDLKNIEKEELFFLRSRGTQAMAKKNYEKAVFDFEKSVNLYNKHKFEGINGLSLKKQLKEAAQAYTLNYYREQLQKKGNSLSALEKNQQELEGWVEKYELSKGEGLKTLVEDYYKNIGVVVVKEDQSFRNTLSNTIGEKDYISAYRILTNQNHLLENYDGKYGIDYTKIKQERVVIKDCSQFQQSSNNTLLELHQNTYQKVNELYDLQYTYQTNAAIRERIDKPSFIPLMNFLQPQSAYVIYCGAEVFNKRNEIENAYQLLILSLEKKYAHEKTENLQKVIAEQLAYLDKKNKKYAKKKDGVNGRIKRSLKKEMKAFKKAYKNGW